MSSTIHGIEVSWDRVRDLFALDPDTSYLNHGGYGAVPTPVQRAQQRLRDEMEANPTNFFNRGLIDRIGHVRRHIASFLGADPELTALVPNATAGVAVVLGSIRFEDGDEVIVTNHGYGSVRLALEQLGQRDAVRVNEVPIRYGASDDEIVAALVGAVRPGRTRLVIVDQITSPTAMLMPVARVAAAVRELGVLVLADGAHAPGMLAVDVTALGADYWVGNLHKWAFAPRPTGVLVVGARHRDSIQPRVVSWEQPQGFPTSIEYAGTLDYTAWLAAPTGLHLLRTLGIDEVRQHNIALVDYGQRAVAAAARVDPAELRASPGVSMRVIPLPAGVAQTEQEATSLREQLYGQYRCEVALQPWQGRGYLRLGAQVYNRESDMDRLADALSVLLDQQRSRRAA